MTPTLTEARILAGTFASAGVDLPPAAVMAFELADAAYELANRPFTDDLGADLTAGRLTTANLEKRLLAAATGVATRDAMRTILQQLDARIGTEAWNAIRRDRDRVLDDLRQRVLAAGQTIVDGLRHMRPGDFNDPARVLAAGPEAAVSYHECAAALRDLEVILDLVRQLTYQNRPGMPPSWAYFVTIDETKAGASTRSDLNEAFAGDSTRWLRLWSVPAVVPALHGADGAAAVVAALTAAEHQAETTRRMKGQPRSDAMRQESIRREAEHWQATVPAPTP